MRPKLSTFPRLMTLREVCEYLDTDGKAVRVLQVEGKLTTVRTPGGTLRYRAEDVYKQKASQ